MDELTVDTFSATVVSRLKAEGLLTNYTDGIHTLAGDSDLTFIDVKRVDGSLMAHWIKLQHKFGRTLWREAKPFPSHSRNLIKLSSRLRGDFFTPIYTV
ncbi:hypothetical protein [Asticcacaulis sp. MM231]|uniref:hypothetical protein n=1 Tax=Asticcacaulis sp. MM231 TaxID=3157666 RepID=UPI0032D58AEE